MIFVFASLQSHFSEEYELVFFFIDCKMLKQIFSLVLTFKIIKYKLYLMIFINLIELSI